MKKYYNFETMFHSLADAIEEFMLENNIYYEISSCTGGWHYEILCSPEELKSINNFLDTQTIQNV